MMGKMILKFLNSKFTKSMIIGVIFLVAAFNYNMNASANPNEVKLLQSITDEDQLKNQIANDPRVIIKWALLAKELGFNYCNGTKSEKVGEDFSIIRDENENYIIQANYNPNDPYASGENASERLRITLSNFKFKLNPSDFHWENPVLTKSAPVVDESYEFQNPNDKENIENKQYQYSTDGTIANETSLQLGDKIKLDSSFKTQLNFKEIGKSINLEISPRDGWKNTKFKIDGNIFTSNYKTKVPPHTRKILEKTIQNVSYKTKYNSNVYITYTVTLHGSLKKDGNARIDHPSNEPIVDLVFGNDKESAAEDLWDMYSHSGVNGYNTWVDWNWVRQNYNDCNEVIQNMIYKSPEFVKINGTFTYSNTITNLRDGKIVPLYPLSTVSLGGSIPAMHIGNSFDLTRLTLSGKDLNQYAYYDFNKLPVTWTIVSGNNLATINGNNLVAKGEGTGTLVALVQGVTSNPINFSFKDIATLNNITIDGTIPNLYEGDSYDLSQLGVIGKDQYGNPYYIPPDQISWSIETGSNIAAISGSLLKVNSPGSGSLSASFQGIKSSPISFTCNSKPYLKSLKLTGSIPDLSVGDNYNLSQLTLQGIDQYGNTYNISVQAVIWSATLGGNLISINSNTLTTLAQGTSQIAATLLGVTSNSIGFQIKNYLSLQNLKIQGTIPNLYVGDAYNLDQLNVSGTDQNGNPWDISGQPITWSITSGNNCASLNGNILKAGSEGNVVITATVLGISSNPINVTIRSIPVLKSITLTGTIPILIVGNSYNLSQLAIKGTDQYGNFFNISNLPVNYSILSGGNFASISGNNLIAYGADASKPGYGTIKATVSGISSGTVNFTVKNPLVLSSLSLSGNIPNLYTGTNFDLSNLTLTGKDQYGDSFNISGKSITWAIVSGGNIVSISNNILKANNAGTGALTATISGITSNQINFTVQNNPGTQRVLKTLLISSAIPTLYVGGTYDLSGLVLYGYDQYGDTYNINGQYITWSIVSGWNNATISYNILRGSCAGSGLITATINGITSNQVSFSILNYGGGTGSVLRSLMVSGSIPTMYAGGSYDLSSLTLYGYDQYGNVFNLAGQPITWSITSGWNSFTITNSILRAYNAGTAVISATVNGVTSNQISVTASSYYTLRTVSLNGTIPSLAAGDTFDLSRLSLLGYDQYGNFYNIAGQPISWAVSSGTNIASISGNTLRVTGVGTGSIIAYVLGVPSNQISFTVHDALVLKTITLTDTKPVLSVGKKYDLSQLSLKGFDQYGNPLNISTMPTNWSVSSVNGLVGVSGNFLIASGVDNGNVTASIQGITSNPIAFRAVKDPQVLTKLDLSGYIPNLSIGKSFNLSSLNLSAVDQYGDPYNLSNEHIAWSIVSGGNAATISGNILTVNSDGTITIAATVKGISSNAKTIIIIKDAPILKTIAIGGNIPVFSVGVRFDLSKLNITAKDQYGNPYNINSRYVIWRTTTAVRNAFITGSTLMPMVAGTQTITATVGGVTSKPVTITIKSTTALKTIVLGGGIPTVKVGKNYDLSKLTLAGKDQYGKPYDIYGKTISWKIVSGSKAASISGKLLTAKTVGIVKVEAVVGGITSNSINIIIKK